MLEPRVIAEIEVGAINADRVQALHAVDEIELCDRLAERWMSVCVRDDLVLQEVWLGAAVDPVPLKVVLLIERVKSLLGAIIPIQGDTMVACNRFYHGLVGRLGEAVARVIYLLDC